MARKYSYDLRMKIFKELDDGLSIVKACKIFNISRNTIYMDGNILNGKQEILKQNLIAQPKVIMQK
ncbi:transposase family protein [Orientia tsutsugamushi str. UT144]|uniref:Transposase family protein n=1 Tax=Orientia tsutsugamushi str. UT144 TaxID=1441384 RepID=A0A0F3RMB7_ORITS|nr:transposase family protein [Orientia tsutsugamushi str. UT144]